MATCGVEDEAPPVSAAAEQDSGENPASTVAAKPDEFCQKSCRRFSVFDTRLRLYFFVCVSVCVCVCVCVCGADGGGTPSDLIGWFNNEISKHTATFIVYYRGNW